MDTRRANMPRTRILVGDDPQDDRERSDFIKDQGTA